MARREFPCDIRLKDFGNDAVLYVISEMTDIERIAGMECVYSVQAFLALRLDIKRDRSVHVAHVLHCRAQVLAGEARLSRIEKYRLLANALKCTVNPFGSVPSREGIGAERYLEQGKPTRVGFLTNIRL